MKDFRESVVYQIYPKSFNETAKTFKKGYTVTTIIKHIIIVSTTSKVDILNFFFFILSSLSNSTIC